MQPAPSSQLIAQVANRRVVVDLLLYLERDKWQLKYSENDLIVEFWDSGIWVKQCGVISYSNLAEFLGETTRIRAQKLEVIERSPNLWLVEGSQKSYYAVSKIGGNLKCECMKWRCLHKRMKDEWPQLFESMGKTIYCHHTTAIAIRRKK